MLRHPSFSRHLPSSLRFAPILPFRSLTVVAFTIRAMASSSQNSAEVSQQPIPWPGARTYEGAIEALNSLQSNAAFIEAKRKAGPQFVDGLPMEVENLTRIGHQVSQPSAVESVLYDLTQCPLVQPSDLNKLNVIHITGTKGKGSTSAFCDSLLRRFSSSSAKKIGLYTSPHMIAARERIRINGLPLSEELFAKYFFEVWDRLGENAEVSLPYGALPGLIELTCVSGSQRKVADAPLRPLYFRFLTTLCFHVFLAEKVDATILEVGIGGRYDSTNIVPKPNVTGITSLGIDHTFMLGNTIEEIAWQKGGIYKAGVPALTVQQKPEALEVLKKCAQEAGALPFEQVPTAHHWHRKLPHGLGLPGAHQIINASLAVALTRYFLASSEGQEAFPDAAERIGDGKELSVEEVEGLEAARWPGRCQVVPSSAQLNGITWYLDGAHTTDSLQLCTQWFVERSKIDAVRHGVDEPVRDGLASSARRVLIFNCTSGRSAPSLLKSILDEIEGKLAKETSPAGASGTAGPYPLARAFFNKVLFCTNITYSDGGSKGDLVSKAVDPSDLSALTVQRELQQAWNGLVGDESHGQVQILPSIQHAIEIVESQDKKEGADSHVLVTGSLHLVGGVMSHLKDRGLLDEALVSIHQAQQVPATK
jgi:folylpolyglutamate synthase